MNKEKRKRGHENKQNQRRPEDKANKNSGVSEERHTYTHT